MKGFKKELQRLQREKIREIIQNDKHLIVTEGSIDDWIAQNLNLSLDAIDQETLNELPQSI